MDELLGKFRFPRGETEVESLNLRFSAGSLPIKQRWRNNGLSADFLADYVSTFFPREEGDPGAVRRRDAIIGAVKYIANELLENAMKYGADTPEEPVSILLQLDREGISFWESNGLGADRLPRFRGFVEELLASDPSEFYFRQLEGGGDDQGSGLGFLTMVNDYAAELSWRFEGRAAGTVLATTHVYLSI